MIFLLFNLFISFKLYSLLIDLHELIHLIDNFFTQQQNWERFHYMPVAVFTYQKWN